MSKRLTENQKGWILALYASGLSKKAIARIIGCSDASVRYAVDPAFREARAKYIQGYYESNREALLAYQHRYYDDNKEAVRDRGREYYQENRDVISERQREYYEDNKESKLRYQHEYYEDNKEAVLEKVSQYRKTPQGKAVRQSANVRRRRQVLEFKHDEHWHKQLLMFRAECPPGYDVDHIWPVSKGGLEHLANLQYLTKEENSRKSAKVPCGITPLMVGSHGWVANSCPLRSPRKG